jgi:nucleotide-binding universal stress UspA family protein
VTVVTHRIDPDSPFAEALTDAVSHAPAELVVMATHGRGPFARIFLGSVTDDVVRHSPAPVLVLRSQDPGSPPNLSRRPKLRHLIVPLDGSDLAERVIEPAVTFGAAFGADYTLLLVLGAALAPDGAARIGRPDAPGSVNPTTPSEQAERYLGRVAQSIAERGGAADTRVAREESAAAAILALAGERPATGVALATHARSGLTRLLTGSVADEVIRHAPGPVLVFHPPG